MHQTKSAEPASVDTPQIVPQSTLAQILSYALFLPYVVLFFSLLILFDILLRLSHGISRRLFLGVARLYQRTMINSLLFFGAKLDIEHWAGAKPEGPVLIVCNHQSMFDIPALYCAFSQFAPVFVAKIELARWIPGISSYLKRDGSAIIDRSDASHALEQIKALCARLRGEGRSEDSSYGKSAILFPEGTRARNGVMKPFRVRGLCTMIEELPGVTLIPAAIDGSWKIHSNRWRVPFGFKLCLRIGEPRRGDTLPQKQLAALLENDVRELLAEIRKSEKTLSV